MFFGKLIIPHIPEPLSQSTSTYQTIQLNNAALSKHSEQAELYLKLNEQQILICEFNRKLGILHHTLSLVIDLKDSPALITKNGNVHVCGYYQAVNPAINTVQETKVTGQSTTTKKSNQLQSKFQKAQTIPPQTLSTTLNVAQNNQNNQDNKSKETQQNFTPRQSSRLSSRRSNTPNSEPAKPSVEVSHQKKQKTSKKDQKQQKKSGQQKALLANGRFNLKKLLQNIDDDDDSDEESSVEFDEEEDDDSEDDDDFDEDDSEEEEQEKKPKKKVKEGNNDEGKKRKLNIQEEAQISRPQQKAQQKPLMKLMDVVNMQQSTEKKNIESQVETKCPQKLENQKPVEDDGTLKRIQLLASKLKVPTIKPTI